MKKKKISPEDELEAVEALSEEEIKILNAQSQSKEDRSKLPEYDTSDLAKARRFAKKNKFTVVFVIATVILLIALIVALSVMLGNKLSDAPSTDDFSVTLGEEKLTLKYKDAMRDGVFYFDIRKIAAYADLVVSGGDGRIKISSPDGSYVRFESGKDTATVNGTRVLVGGKVYINEKTDKSEGECLVPFSFIQDLFSYKRVSDSVSVKIRFTDDDNTVIIRRVVYSETGEPLPISFSADCFDIANG